MMRYVFSLLVLLTTLLSGVEASAAREKKALEPEARIEVVLSPEKTVAGVSSVYSVVVYSNVPDVLRAEIIKDPRFGALKTSELRLGRGSDTYVGERTDQGVTWYGFVIDNIVVSSDKTGSYEIKGGEYRICLGVEGYTDDFFFGRRRTQVPVWVEASAPDVKLSVKKRPASLSLDSAVSSGDFTVSWIVPPGDMYEGNRAVTVYKISGKGVLDRLTAPDFKEIFGEELNVVYVKPEVKTYLKGTDLWSEMEVVVEFIPSVSGEVELPEVEFEYLDPQNGKMKTSKPKKSTVVIKSDKRSPSTKAPIYEI